MTDSKGPYRFENNIIRRDGIDTVFWALSEYDAKAFAAFGNKAHHTARREAIEACVKVVEKIAEQYDLKGGPLDREARCCDAVTKQLRALLGAGEKEGVDVAP